MKKIEIKNMNSLKTTKKLEKLDVAFVEGAISSENEAPRLRQIRKNSRVLIALGSGACNGYPSNLRNTFNYEKKNKIQPLLKRFHQNESVEPIKHFVKVDAALNGCPVRAEDIDKMIRERIKCMK
jgi:coenzyme F420-reducing hydrogenase gamma subunit